MGREGLGPRPAGLGGCTGWAAAMAGRRDGKQCARGQRCCLRSRCPRAHLCWHGARSKATTHSREHPRPHTCTAPHTLEQRTCALGNFHTPHARARTHHHTLPTRFPHPQPPPPVHRTPPPPPPLPQGPEDYLEVVLARADFLRRAAAAPAAPAAAAGALRALFSSASELMGSYFPDHLDRALRLPAYWAHCEAHALGDAAAARAVWEGVLKGPLGRRARGRRGWRPGAGTPSVWSAAAAAGRGIGEAADTLHSNNKQLSNAWVGMPCSDPRLTTSHLSPIATHPPPPPTKVLRAVGRFRRDGALAARRAPGARRVRARLEAPPRGGRPAGGVLRLAALRAGGGQARVPLMTSAGRGRKCSPAPAAARGGAQEPTLS
jgi:hypothetical protein